jgi:thioredoxin-like negative regulator of GroEL
VTSLVLAALLLGGAPEVKGGIRWERDFEIALKKAKSSGKPVMIDFWADWCGWCHRLDETTYRDPKVLQLSKSFVPLKLNAEGTRAEVAIAVRYGVSSLPTIAFISPSGRMVLLLQGFQGPAQFPKVMEQAKTMASKLIGWETTLAKNPDDPEALLGLGVHLLDGSLYDEARELLARAREVDASRPVTDRKQTRLLLGTLEYYGGRHPQAEQILKEGLALPTPTEYDPKLLYVLGKNYLKWGRTQEARRTLQSVVNDYASNPIAQKAKESLVAMDAR